MITIDRADVELVTMGGGAGPRPRPAEQNPTTDRRFGHFLSCSLQPHNL